MSTCQITGTRKDGADADRRIDGACIGSEYRKIDTIINWIRNGEHRFYVSVRGVSVWVVVKVHPTSGRFYLTTEGDGFPPNNLLNLPDC